MVAEGLLGERGENYVEVFLEEGLVAGSVTPIRRLAKMHAGPTVDARRDAEIDPALGHLVEENDVLRNPQRVPVGEDDAALSDAQPIAVARHVGAEQDGIRPRAVPTVPGEMMFRQPHPAETELVEPPHGLVRFVEEERPRILLSNVVVERAVEAHTGPLTVPNGAAQLYSNRSGGSIAPPRGTTATSRRRSAARAAGGMERHESPLEWNFP